MFTKFNLYRNFKDFIKIGDPTNELKKTYFELNDVENITILNGLLSESWAYAD